MRLSYKYQTIKKWTVLECFDRYYIGVGRRISSYFCLARNIYASIIYVVDSQWNAQSEWKLARNLEVVCLLKRSDGEVELS